MAARTQTRMNGPSSLPYQDTKPVGAADFYFGINATFRFIRQRLGDEGLVRYWTRMGSEYYAPVSRLWRDGALPAVATYWRDFFAAEPGAEVEVHQESDAVVLNVKKCPAITHLREGQREIEPHFCRHCYHVSEAMAEPAGLTVRVEGGNGSCRQRFLARAAAGEPQDLNRINSCT